jgi:hypothetical protein
LSYPIVKYDRLFIKMFLVPPFPEFSATHQTTPVFPWCKSLLSTFVLAKEPHSCLVGATNGCFGCSDRGFGPGRARTAPLLSWRASALPAAWHTQVSKPWLRGDGPRFGLEELQAGPWRNACFDVWEPHLVNRNMPMSYNVRSANVAGSVISW